MVSLGCNKLSMKVILGPVETQAQNVFIASELLIIGA